MSGYCTESADVIGKQIKYVVNEHFNDTFSILRPAVWSKVSTI